jgi:ABC-type multidrug transport system permease subunit
MKLFKIISKNFKVLVRSKSSALVVILGPLLLILLVGLSFSNSSTFTLKIGVYSPVYNELTNSYIAKLNDTNYKITKFNSETECVDNIKQSAVHTCIIFPQNFEIINGKTNEIKFYVDQTKQNFVYAVVNTVSSSFTERSSELSLDMTTRIINVMTRTKTAVEKTKNTEFSAISESNNKVLSRSKVVQDKLSSNNVNISGVSSSTGSLDSKADILRNRISLIYSNGASLLELSLNITEAGDFSDPNKTRTDWQNDIDNYDGPDGLLYQSWNNSIAAKDDLVNTTKQITSSVTTLVKNVENARDIEISAVADLKNGLDLDAEALQERLKTADASLSGVINDINTLSVTSAENIISPISTTIETVTPEKSNLDYLFPSLIVLLIMMISIMLSSTLIIMEKNSKAYFRNFTTPTNDVVFTISTFLTSVIIMVAQTALVLVISTFIFHTNFSGNLQNISILILLISSLFVLIGMVVGYLFNSEQTGMIGAISISSIFLMTSDLILPIENMPIYIQEFARYNPFVLSSEALKKSILFSSSLKSIQHELLLLGLMIVSIFIIIVIVEKIAKVTFFKRFALYRKRTEERPENIREIFRIDGHLIKDQKELYRFIKGLKRREYKSLVFRRTNRVADFAHEVLQDKVLAENLSKVRTRWGILKTIEKHNLISNK